MTIVSVGEARARLADLLARVRNGEEFAIVEDSEVLGRLVPPGRATARRPGSLKGQIALTAAFFDPLPDDEQAGWGAE